MKKQAYIARPNVQKLPNVVIELEKIVQQLRNLQVSCCNDERIHQCILTLQEAASIENAINNVDYE